MLTTEYTTIALHKKESFLKKLLIWLPVTISYLSIVYFCFFTNQYFFHSDAAMMQIWAEEIINSKSMISPDFVYAEPRQTFNYHFLAIPLLLIQGHPSYFNHALVQSVFALILLFSFIWFCKTMNFSRMATVLTTALFFSSAGQRFADMFWGQQAYAFEALVTIVVFVMAYKFIVSYNSTFINTSTSCKRSPFYHALLLFIICLLVSLNGARVHFGHLLPIVCGLLAVKFLEIITVQKSLLKWRECVYLAFIIGLAIIISMLLTKFVIAPDFTHFYSSSMPFLPWETIKQNIANIPNLLISQFNQNPLKSLRTINYLHIYAVFIMSVPIVLTLLYRRINLFGFRWLLFMYWTALVLSLSVIVTMMVNPDSYIHAARYCYVFIIPAFMLLPFLLDYLRNKGHGIILKTLIICLIPVWFFNIISLWDANIMTSRTNVDKLAAVSNLLTSGHREKQDEILELIEFAGIKYYYGNFWDAHKYTILSKGKIRGYSLAITDTIFTTTALYHYSKQWYDATSNPGPSGILIRRNDLNKPDMEYFNQHYSKRAVKTLESRNYLLFIFDYNVAQDIQLSAVYVKQRPSDKQRLRNKVNFASLTNMGGGFHLSQPHWGYLAEHAMGEEGRWLLFPQGRLFLAAPEPQQKYLSMHFWVNIEILKTSPVTMKILYNNKEIGVLTADKEVVEGYMLSLPIPQNSIRENISYSTIDIISINDNEANLYGKAALWFDYVAFTETEIAP